MTSEEALATAALDTVLDAFVRASMGDGNRAQTLLGTTVPSLSYTWQGLLRLGLGQVTDALALIKRGAERLELDALELYRGFRPFVEDRGLQSELDISFRAPSRDLTTRQ